jgi:hypothetical protein
MTKFIEIKLIMQIIIEQISEKSKLIAREKMLRNNQSKHIARNGV